ncbi:lipid II flippase FtsW [Oxobacter pfennigii]|uniref:Probable peptidoglycan glycosyltransferase FtsW n=1 Tax=Oxobacter pfennigii TaxID=36849 RepID=A0A0P8WNB5_9CLOT|nr:stage V sporulation protein E [Oxobacter pfennigii]KPU44039.1 lipid II flippase FtsW [Oxobacter pfennigii]
MARKRGSCDFFLMLMVFALLAIGLVMVFSASSVTDLAYHKDAFYTFKRQLAWAGMGLLAMVFTMNFDYHNLKKLSKPLLILAIILLIVVLFMPERNGARRWIGMGNLSLQPSEVAKFAVILYMASGLTEKKDKIKNFVNGVLPFVLVGGLIFALILIEPNLSVAGTVLIVVFFMLIAAGARKRHLTMLALLGSAAAVVFTMSEDYRYRRFTAFLDPWKDPLDTGYQAIQSLLAIGSGGLMGAGLGKSHQKFFYIPEPQTDFIFSIIGEELGFLGASSIMILFLILIWRGIKIAINAPDNFGSFLAAGITSLIAVQTLINIAVATSSMPITGIPLPFISYGGSSLTFMMAAVGILLNISRYEKA